MVFAGNIYFVTLPMSRSLPRNDPGRPGLPASSSRSTTRATTPDWPGEHTAKVRVHEFVAMANRLGVYQMLVQPVGLAPDTDDPTILPLDAPSGQRRIGERAGAVSVYDPDRHGPKPDVTFARPVYFAFDIVLVVGAGSVELRYRDDPEATSQRPFVTWRAPGAGPAITAP